jgi:ABC-type uncharacterized transport system substrate-binding protein
MVVRPLPRYRIALLPVLAACGVVPFAGGPAMAHPHIFVDTIAEMVMDKGRIQSVRVRWTFDPLYSGMLLGAYDADGDGTFNDAEERLVYENSFRQFGQSGYYTLLLSGREPRPWKQATGFAAAVADDRVSFVFTVDLVAPADPAAGEMELAVYDPTNYVYFGLVGEQPVTFSGQGSERCAYEFTRSEIMVRIDCGDD